MTLPHDDPRLMDLELKVLELEHSLEQLNTVVIRQQDQIDRLLRELQDVSRRLPEDGAPRFRSLRDELPPHY